MISTIFKYNIKYYHQNDTANKMFIYYTISAVNLLTGLKVLSLATNHLSQLLTGDLSHCTDLKILQLEDNLISTVAAGALQKHEDLKVI